MTRQVTLSSEQEAELLQTYRTTDDLWLRERCQAVLMVARGGRTRQDIARDLDVSPRTLRRYVESYLADGLSGLVVQWYTGPQRKISAEVGEEIVRWVREGPSGCGLERANWTLEELAEHLYRTHGVRVCPETMRQFCLQRNIRMYRPSYRYLRGDEDKQEKAREELAELQKSRGGRDRPAEPG
jgi:transposase